MSSASSTVQNAAGSTCVYENRTGTGHDGGIWTWPAWTNNNGGNPNNFTTAWTLSGSGLVTNNAVTSPDGTADGATINKNQTTGSFADTQTITTNRPVAISFWFQKSSPASGAPGMDYWNGTGANDGECFNHAQPLPTAWTRNFYWLGSQSNTTAISPLYALAPTGLQCAPTFTNSASGAVNYWGMQTTSAVDYPVGNGAIAAQYLQLNSDQLSRLVVGGDFEVDAFARVWTQELRSQPAGCLFGGTGSQGETSLCYTPNINSATAALWTFKVAGATVLTSNMGVPLYGGEIRARAECRASTNTAVLRLSVMGSTMFSEIATGTCHGGVALAALTSFYLGSNNGTAATEWPAQITRLVSYTRQQAYNRDEIVWLGDSISSWTPQTDASGNRLDNVAILSGVGGSASANGGAGAIGTLSTGGIYTMAQARNLIAHPGIAAVVTPGAKCEDIEATYITTPYYQSGFSHAHVIECGTNNINPAGGNQTVAQAAPHFQHFVNTIAAGSPGRPIICAQITPWAAQATAVTAYNDCIAGGGGGQCAGAGAAPITGCTYVVTNSFTSLNSGGTCTRCPDNVHPDNLGRQMMTTGTGAGTYVGALTSAGVLP
jgi:hypothetical protein